MTYEQAKMDHDYLWETYDQAADSGCMDEEAGKVLLHNPSKATAKNILISRIVYWFQAGPENGTLLWARDDKVWEIARRHQCTDDYSRLLKYQML